ncbi:hypothetical protein LCGC14_1544760, partial [marine sediment metagenome]
MDSKSFPIGNTPFYSKYVAGVLTFFRRSDHSEFYSIDGGNRRLTLSGPVTISGVLTQSGAVTQTASSNLLSALFNTASEAAPVIVGAGAAAAGLEVGGITGVASAITVNWLNSAATITGMWSGLDIKLEDAGAGAQNTVPIRTQLNKTAGNATGVAYGYFGSVTCEAGKEVNVTSIRAQATVKTAAFEVGLAGRPYNVCSAIFATLDIDTLSTYTADVWTAAIIGHIIGNSSHSATKQKADAIFLAELGGDSAQATVGA